MMPDTFVQVILPVYNEASGIEKVLREFNAELSPLVRVQFVICEDGSSDGTRAILERLAKELPIQFVYATARRGYSKAIIDGWRQCTAPWVLALDSDGQCDARDFSKFLPLLSPRTVIMGWRVRRRDSPARLAMTGLFRLLYRLI